MCVIFNIYASWLHCKLHVGILWKQCPAPNRVTRKALMCIKHVFSVVEIKMIAAVVRWLIGAQVRVNLWMGSGGHQVRQIVAETRKYFLM